MAINDRLNGLYRLFGLIWLSIQLHYKALKEATRKDGLSVLRHLQRVRDTATARLFSMTSNGFVAFENTTVVPTLMRSAYGRVIELGPGSGNQIHRYDSSRVELIYGIEPNASYRDVIAAKVEKAGLKDKYKLLTCGLEDSDILQKESVEEGSMDTILSIQVLCAVDDVRGVMREAWKLLKPGGGFVFWEHVTNKDSATAITQTCLDPIWSTFVGCHMNRNVLKDILAAGEWENPGDIEIADEPYSYLPRIWGVLKKKA